MRSTGRSNSELVQEMVIAKNNRTIPIVCDFIFLQCIIYLFNWPGIFNNNFFGI